MDTQPSLKRRFDSIHITLFVLLAVMITAVSSYFLIRIYLFPASFKPVQLSEREAQVLHSKLERLDFSAPTPTRALSRVTEVPNAHQPLEPEPYTEKNADRTIRLTERELNALLARNTDLADKVAIDLSRDLISAKILIPVDPDFPVIGGKILRVKTGLTLSYFEGRPVVILRGVSMMGVPLPNAWLGNLKNIDLAGETGNHDGFWKAFADGVDDVRVEDGMLTITLKE